MKTQLNKILLGLVLLIVISGTSSCEKFLNQKTDLNTVIPENLRDLQALLDAAIYINYGYYPGLLEATTDDFYISQSSFNSLRNFDKDIYLWRDYPFHEIADVNKTWTFAHRNLNIANTVLDEVDGIQSSDEQWREHIKGSAHFYRGYVLFQLALSYCDLYVPGGENSELGLPMRLSADFNFTSRRYSVQQTYEQILEDLHQAYKLLPQNSEVPTRPNKLSASAALSKVYLVMGDYERALDYANEVLIKYNELMDYNLLNASATLPIERFNKEVLYYAYSFSQEHIKRAILLVDTTLYDSYSVNDLRKTVYFFSNSDGSHGFKAYYSGANNTSFFMGITTSEMVLIQAECEARLGHVDLALEALNYLLKHRYKTGTYTPFQNMTKQECLDLVLLERRKELLFRGVRWSDLKRLNKDPRYARTLERRMEVDGRVQIFSLPPNDPRYNFTIPDEVIQKSGIPQNPR